MSGSIIDHALNSSARTVRITITSWWARWRLKSPAPRFFTQELFRRTSKKTSKIRVTGLCEGNSPGTGEFPAQMASNAENVSIWWRHHGAIITRFWDDCPRSERPRISHALPGRTWASWGPAKRQIFCWWNVQMRSIQRQCCILTKFKFAMKSTCVFIDISLSGEQIEFHRHQINANLILDFSLYVSSSVCCIKTVGLISMQFTGIVQLHILYIFTKIYVNWMSASDSLLCLYKRPSLLHA